MGGSKSKPLAESARTVLAQKSELLKANKAVVNHESVASSRGIPGLTGKASSVSTQTLPTVYPRTGDVNPEVHAGLSKIDFVKMASDTNMQKHKQEMIRAPQAAVIREQEIKAIMQDRKNKGIFTGDITAPGKISEQQLMELLDKLKLSTAEHSVRMKAGASEFGLDVALLTTIYEKSIRLPVLSVERGDDGEYHVAK